MGDLNSENKAALKRALKRIVVVGLILDCAVLVPILLAAPPQDKNRLLMMVAWLFVFGVAGVSAIYLWVSRSK
jgi:hypothetical protein